jgi:prepilin-type N-terminal cleavage/methylation domain-containing protein
MARGQGNVGSGAPRAAGFTLMEVLVTLTVIALLFALVIPNLGAFVPTARLQGSGKQLLRTIDWARSEARIQARPMALELDLERARWRVVLPPELRLTRDQNEEELMEWSLEWNALESGVVFSAAGDAKHGPAKKGVYRIEFDPHGFSSDQIVVLRMPNEPKLVWALTLRGLTGVVTVFESEEGQEPDLQYVEEGAF